MFAFRAIISAIKNISGGGAATLSLSDQYWSSVALLVNADGYNGANNRTFVDSSSNNFTITSTGSPVQGSMSPFNDGWAGDFSAAAGYLTAPSHTSNTFTNTKSYTIETWILCSTRVLGSVIFQFGATATAGSAALTWNTAGVFTFAVGASLTSSMGSLAKSSSSWTHVALVHNFVGGTITLYVNGISVGIPLQNSSGFGATFSGILQIGAGDVFSNYRIVNGTAVYLKNFTPPTVPLTAITNTTLLTFQNNRFVDNSANNLALTANGCDIRAVNPYSQWNSNYWSGNFSGAGTSYLSIPANTAFDFGSGDFTIECWVNFSKVTGVQTIINSRYNNGGLAGPFLIYTNGAAVSFWSSSNGSSFDIASGQSIIAAAVINKWYHIAITRSGSNFKIFVNGVQTNTFTSSAALYSATLSPIDIGSNAAHGDLFAGLISDVRLVKGSALYTAAFTPPITKLTNAVGTSLLTCQDNTFIDRSSNNFTITSGATVLPYSVSPYGNPSGTPYSSTINGSSAQFFGTDYLSIPNDAAFDFGAGDFTIECWLNLKNKTASNLVRKGISTTFGPFAISNSGTVAGRIELYSSSNGTSHDIANGTPIANSFELNTWNHIAVTRQGSLFRLFANGTLTTSFTNAAALASNTNPVTIFSAGDGANKATGLISNLRIVKGMALYTAAFTPPVAPLSAVAGTSLLLTNSNTAIFDSAFKTNISTVSTSQISTSTFKYGTGAIKFNGTSDYLTLQNSSSQFPPLLYLPMIYTAECWFNPASTAAAGTLFFLNGAAGTYAGMRLDVTAGGKLQLLATTASGSWTINVTSTLTMTVGTWYHIAVVRNGTSVIAYLNGTVAASGTLSGTSYNGGSNIIGVALGTTFYLNGYVDDLRITPGVARYANTFTPPAATLPNHG